MYLVNRLPCKGHKDLTPEEAWSGRKPTLNLHLKTFGCMAIVQVPKEKRRKLDAKGKESLFVGLIWRSRSMIALFSKKHVSSRKDA